MPLLIVPNFAPLLVASVVDPARLPLPPSMVRTEILPYAPVALYTRRITRVDDPWLPVALDIWKRSFPERDRAPLSKWVGLLNEYADGQTSSRCLLTATPAGGTRPARLLFLVECLLEQFTEFILIKLQGKRSRAAVAGDF